MSAMKPERYPHSPEVASTLEIGAEGYGWPKFGHDAEMKSLLYHVQLRDNLREDMPCEDDRKIIMSYLEKQYQSAKWRIPDDFMSYEHFQRSVQRLDMTSSPGYPYLKKATTNAVFFQARDGVVPEDRMREVWEVLQLKMRERLVDPIRLFIKPEAHKNSKLEGHRYRLISSVSVLDQLIDVMLFGEMNDKVTQQCVHVPCKGGWSAYAGGWKIVPPRGVISIDKSGWDWSVNAWYFEMELQLRVRLCENIQYRWLEMATWRYQALFGNPWFVTSGGLLLRQRKAGVMKSGCFNTLVSNSIMQSILHLRVCSEIDVKPGWIWTLGDDTLQEDLPEREQYLKQAAQYCHIKHCVEGAEFAGYRFGKSIEPLYRGKHSFNLLHLNPKFAKETAEAYALLYHRSCKSLALKRMLGELLGASSDESRDAIWDGW